MSESRAAEPLTQRLSIFLGLTVGSQPVNRVYMPSNDAAARVKALLFLGIWAGFVALGTFLPLLLGRGGTQATLGAISFGLFGLIVGPLLAYGIVRLVARLFWD